MRSSLRPRFLAALAAVIPLALFGCASPPSAPIVRPAGLSSAGSIDASIEPSLDGGLGTFVDLRDGRRTELRFHAEAWVVFPDGSVGERISDDWTLRSDVVGEEIVGGVAYRLVEETDPANPGDAPFEALFRQDRSGLYLWQKDAGPIARNVIAADVPRSSVVFAQVERAIAASSLDLEAADALRRAAARIAARSDAVGLAGPPGGAGASEITFLRYPLRPGASWVGREDFNVWTVEARENLDTAAGPVAAWRLNIVLPRFFGPNDRYQTWWGAPGEVQRRSHLEGEAVDSKGNVIGVLVFEDEAELITYEPGS